MGAAIGGCRSIVPATAAAAVALTPTATFHRVVPLPFILYLSKEEQWSRFSTA